MARACTAIISCCFSSARRSIAYWAIVSTAPTSAMNPVLPCSMTSGSPPTRVVIGTTLQAIASSAASPNDSSSLGKQDREFLLYAILLSQKDDILVDSFLYCQPFGFRTIRAIADQKQFGRYLFANAIEDLDHICDALHGSEVGKMNEHLFTG